MFVRIIGDFEFLTSPFSCVTPVLPSVAICVIGAVLLLEVSHGSRGFAHCSIIGPITWVSGCGAFFATQTRLSRRLNAQHLPVRVAGDQFSPVGSVCAARNPYVPSDSGLRCFPVLRQSRA